MNQMKNQTNQEIKNDQLQSTKAINQLKLKAIRHGGYRKFKMQIELACDKHLQEFGVDLFPKHLTRSF